MAHFARKFLTGNARYIANPAVYNVLMQRFEYVPNRSKERVSFLCAGCNENCMTRVSHVQGCVRYCSRACLIKDRFQDVRGAARLSSPGNNSSQTDNNVWTLVANAYQQVEKNGGPKQKPKMIKGSHAVSA